MQGKLLEHKISTIIHESDSKHDKLAQILKLIIDVCDIDQSKYFILGSYALREHRTISDLDLNMDFDEFEKLSKSGLGEVQPYNEQIRWFYDMTKEYQEVDPNANDFSIEIFKKHPYEGFPNEKFSLGYLQKHNGLDTDKYGHPFFNLKTLLDWKTTMGRDKDKPDIEMINGILSKSIGGYYKKYAKYKRKYLNSKYK